MPIEKWKIIMSYSHLVIRSLVICLLFLTFYILQFYIDYHHPAFQKRTLVFLPSLLTTVCTAARASR